MKPMASKLKKKTLNIFFHIYSIVDSTLKPAFNKAKLQNCSYCVLSSWSLSLSEAVLSVANLRGAECCQ